GVPKAKRGASAALALARAFGFGRQPAERRARFVNFREHPFDFGQQCVRFFECKKSHLVLIWKVAWRIVNWPERHSGGQLEQAAPRKANSGAVRRATERELSCSRDRQRVTCLRPLGSRRFSNGVVHVVRDDALKQ